MNLSASIPHTVSPSRLLQASTLLTAGDTAYSMSPFHPAQIGMSFNLTVYMLFAGHSHRKDITASDLTWQEVISKGRVKLIRTPLMFDEDDDEDGTAHAMRAQSKLDEYCYELCVIEDLDDGRVHEEEEGRGPPRPLEDVEKAGIRFRIPIHQVRISHHICNIYTYLMHRSASSFIQTLGNCLVSRNLAHLFYL